MLSWCSRAAWGPLAWFYVGPLWLLPCLDSSALFSLWLPLFEQIVHPHLPTLPGGPKSSSLLGASWLMQWLAWKTTCHTSGIHDMPQTPIFFNSSRIQKHVLFICIMYCWRVIKIPVSVDLKSLVCCCGLIFVSQDSHRIKTFLFCHKCFQCSQLKHTIF